MLRTQRLLPGADTVTAFELCEIRGEIYFNVVIWIQPAGIKVFSLLHITHANLGVHPASFPTGTWGTFVGGKAARKWGKPNLHLVAKLRVSWLISHSSSYFSTLCAVTTLNLSFFYKKKAPFYQLTMHLKILTTYRQIYVSMETTIFVIISLGNFVLS
jgi:hypothetical protein